MKRVLIIISIIAVAVSLTFPAVITGGIGIGLGTVSDSDLGDVYGSGFVLNPYLCYGISDNFAIGIGYEAGYKKDGDVGLFDDPAELKISGCQLFAEYMFKGKKLVPYLKLGYGNYTIKNSFETEALKQYNFSKTGSGMIFGGGARFPLNDNFFITGDISYLMLKVKPFTESINAGGLRFLIGLAVDFNI